MACWFTCGRRGHSARLVNSFLLESLINLGSGPDLV